MIRLRKLDGTVTPPPEGTQFIELCDLNGDPAAVIFQDDQGRIHFHQSGEVEFRRYLNLFPGTRAVKVVDPRSEIVPS